MCFDATTGNEQGLPVLTLQSTSDLDGQQPGFIGVPAGDFAEHRASPNQGLKGLHGVGRGEHERLYRQAVGEHQRIDPQPLHQLLHIAAHGGNHRRLCKASPINPVEDKGVVGIPQDGAPFSQPTGPQEAVQVQHRMDRLPFCSQDHCPFPLLQGRSI